MKLEHLAKILHTKASCWDYLRREGVTEEKYDVVTDRSIGDCSMNGMALKPCGQGGMIGGT